MENQDSVCFVGQILLIEDIKDADKIQLATINGWKSIISKNSMKVGDLVLCLTTDAVIPQEFGERHNILTYLRKGNRVRTVKLRGVYSECILILTNETEVGKDMMKTYGILKYEEPEKIIQLPNGRKIRKRDNPNFHIYHKFPNFKNVPNIFSKDDEVVITRKIHGSNWRAGIVLKDKLPLLDKIKRFFNLKYNKYTFVYGSHNVQKGGDEIGYYSEDVWKKIVDKYNIKETLEEWKKYLGNEISGIILYGEIYGRGIQGEKYNYGKKEVELALFDLKIDGEYQDRVGFDYFIEETKLPSVPVLYRGKYKKEIVDSFVKNNFIEGTNIPHEGVVVTHVSGDRSKICKFINPDYLIFGEKNNVPENH